MQGEKPARRVALSFLAMVCGWIAGDIYYVLYMSFFSPHGRLTDLEAMLFWTAVFIFIAWVILVIPLVICVDSKSRLVSRGWAPILGAFYALAVFLVLVGWWTGFWSEFLYVTHAMVVGAVAGLFYSQSLRAFDR